ncbi:MAG: B12-binding domain-containing radical SAM protein [Chloroflexi bacterium]|nr:B12-binding domain-containing radical SAM protein [Chloroflexota bacterium]
MTRSGTLYFPIWLAYATGVLEEAGFAVSLIDAVAKRWDHDATVRAVAQLEPALVVIDTSTPSIHNDIEIANRIKLAAPTSFVVLVGPHVSALPEETLRLARGVDAVARGEYELTLRELARALSRGKTPEGIPGMSYRGHGQSVHNPEREHITDLDEIPLVSRVYARHLNISDYFYAIAPHPTIPIVTGRGCPSQCTFCVYPQVMYGHRHRLRSIGNVVSEFRFIVEQIPGAAGVFIEDDTFTLDRTRCLELCDALIAEGLTLPWAANARPNVDYETMVKMRQAGCRLLCVGFESGEQAVLNNLRKGTTTDRMHRFCRDAKRARLLIHGCFILGAPGETEQSMRRTVQLATELHLDTAQFYPYMVYPGTEAYEHSRSEGYLKNVNYSGWLDRNGQHNYLLSQPGCDTDSVLSLCAYARRRFYLSPGYLTRKARQVMTSSRERRRVVRAFSTFRKHMGAQ